MFGDHFVQGGAVIADAEAQPQPSGHNTEAQVEAAAAAEGAAARAKESLLNAAARARRAAPEETEAEKLLKEERDILHKITQKAALQSVKERAMVSAGDHTLCTPHINALWLVRLTLCAACAVAGMAMLEGHKVLACQAQQLHEGTVSFAEQCNLPFWQGVVYTKSLHTGWKPKLQHRRMTLQQHQDVSIAVAAPSSCCSLDIASSCPAVRELQCALKGRVTNAGAGQIPHHL